MEKCVYVCEDVCAPVICSITSYNVLFVYTFL